MSAACNFAYYLGPTEIALSKDGDEAEQACRASTYNDQIQYVALEKKDLIESYRKQSAERRKNARDYCVQRRSAIASERQANFAFYSLFISGVTLSAAIFAAVFAAMAAWATQDGAEETSRAADYAGDALVAGQRAWIKRKKISIASDVVFNSDDSVGTTVTLEFENVGNTPATCVKVDAWLLTLKNGIVPKDGAQALFEQSRQRKVVGGFTLFPKESYPRPKDYTTQYIARIEGADARPATDEHGRIVLYVAACISYSFSTDPNRWHQTGCLFKVTCPLGIDKTYGNITKDIVSLDESGFEGGVDLVD